MKKKRNKELKTNKIKYLINIIKIIFIYFVVGILSTYNSVVIQNNEKGWYVYLIFLIFLLPFHLFLYNYHNTIKKKLLSSLFLFIIGFIISYIILLWNWTEFYYLLTGKAP